MKQFSLLAFTFLLTSALSLSLFAEESPQTIRFIETEDKGALETALTKFTSSTGTQVDLISVVHVADPEYFEALNKRFEDYDAVLFEMVGGKDSMSAEELAARPKSAVGGFQQGIKNALHLQFQLDAIRYDAPNMIHADMSREEFAAEQESQNESILSLIWNASEEGKKQLLDHPESAPRPILLSDLFRTVSSPDLATELKFIVARQLASSEGLISALESNSGSVIISGRNRIVIEKLREVIDGGAKKIAIFYGGAHMPGIADHLTSDFAMTHQKTTWLKAWLLERPTATPIRASGE